MNTYDLFECIDIIIDARLKELQLDRTLICQIIDNSERNFGKYTVSYESAKFVVNSADYFLENGDLVYVGVPANNYANAFIISKKILEDTMASSLNPFKNYAKFASYQANNCSINYQNSNIYQLPKILQHWQINDYSQYDNLGISVTYNSNTSVDFYLVLEIISNQTIGNNNSDKYQEEVNKVLENTNLSKDEQQQQIDRLKIQYAQQTYKKAEKYVINPSELTSNGFNFPADFTQKKLLDITNISSISEVNLYCQLDSELKTNTEFISIKDIEISFGYLTTKYKEEELSIYCLDGDTYQNRIEKHFYLKWVYLNEKNEVKIYTYKNIDQLPDGVQIVWEKYSNNDWTTIMPSSNIFVLSSILDQFKTSEKFRCRLLYDTLNSAAKVERISNIFTVKNTNNNSSNLIVDKSLKLTASVSDFSNYFNTDGTLVDVSLANTLQTLTLTANTITGLSNINFSGDNIQFIVKWVFPNALTALSYKSLQNYEGIVTKEDDNLIIQHIFSPDDIKSQENLQIKSVLNFGLVDRYLSNKQADNSVECFVQVVRKQGMVTEILQEDQVAYDFIIKRPGVCKTDYVLSLEMNNTQGTMIKAVCDKDTVIVIPKIYDNNGDEFVVQDQFKFSWYYKPNLETQWLNLLGETEENCVIGTQCALKAMFNENGIQDNTDYCYILKAEYELKQGEKAVKTIVGYLPIPLNLYPSIASQLSGPTTIVYNSSGGDPSYYQGAYNLYKKENNNQYIPVVNTTYDLRAKGVSYTADNYDTMYPFLAQSVDQYWISPKGTYIKEADKGVVIIGYQNGVPLWIQPILIYQSNSFSSFVDNWDGSFTLDKENNVAMMARLGAGRKNDDDGTFSGVLLGDWKEIEDGSWHTNTGIYGYDHNLASYAFREDGTAFIGKSGAGRINFNGDLGLIYSAGFDGMFYSVDSAFNINILDEINTLDESRNKYAAESNPLKEAMINFKSDNIQNEYCIISGTIGDVASNYNAKEDYFSYSIKGIKLQDIDSGIYIFEETISVEQLSISKDGYDPTSELCFHFDNCSNFTYDSSSFNSNQITYLSIGTEQNALNKKMRIYHGGKFHIQIQIDISAKISTLFIPLIDLIAVAGNTGRISERDFTFKISDIKLYKVARDETQKDINTPLICDITKIENLKGENLIKLKNAGTQGTFLNLKDGELITNNGTFRGNLQVESMELINEIVIGDPTGNNGSWIRITPDGRFLSSEIGNDITFINSSSFDATSVASSIYNNSASFLHKDIIIDAYDSNSKLFIVQDEGENRRVIYYTSLSRYGNSI